MSTFNARVAVYHVAVAALVFATSLVERAAVADESSTLTLTARSQVKSDSGKFEVTEKRIDWDARKTAIVICDMWNEHWCKGATRRVGQMAPRMNQVVANARKRGVLIIHCPSGTMDHYKGTPQRKLAQQAPVLKTVVPLQRWCYLDPKTEAALPIDDSDGGCDCVPQCKTRGAWTKQIDTIQIEPDDAITDSGEAYYLMRQRGIKNVIVMGVHTNMCVLGRPFSIRQMVYQGQNVVLMRDMTDTMYNPRMKPYVSHFQGTDRVIDHIEKYWCPTVTSADLTGKAAFRFPADKKQHVVFMIGEREYETQRTLPAFARAELEPRGVKCTFVHASADDKNDFPGLEALKTADLMVLSLRRRAPREEQLAIVRKYLAAGGPLVGIRTACHPFHTRGEHPDGHAEWQDFDPQVLGGHYTGHHGEGAKTALKRAAGAEAHAILAGIDPSAFLGNGSLYKVSPLAKSTVPLLVGSIPNTPAEPVAWTHTYHDGRVFYTSLGHPDDFKSEQFNRLLTNAVFWALGRAVPLPETTLSAAGAP